MRQLARILPRSCRVGLRDLGTTPIGGGGMSPSHAPSSQRPKAAGALYFPPLRV